MQFGISEAIQHWGRYRPTAPAVVGEGIEISFQQLNASIDSVANIIDEASSPSTRIAVVTPKRLDLVVAIVAVLRARRSVVLLNPGLTAEAIGCNIHETETRTLLRSINALSNRFESTALLRQIAVDFNALPTVPSPPPRRSLATPSDEWGVLFSSGTTGIPKGIVRDHDSIVTELLGWCIELELTKRTTFYIGRPIFYTGGLVLAFATLLVGGQLVLNDPDLDNADATWLDYQAACETQRVDWAFFVPEQLRAFMELVRAGTPNVSGAQNILVMGAPIAAAEKLRASELLHSNIVESWGNTESLGTITDVEDLASRPDSIGRPFLTDALCIVDEEGNELPPDTPGRIAGGEEGGFLEYSNRPEETNRTKRNALIISEDLGFMDADGYFYICGRESEAIEGRRGVVYSSEMEKQLRTVGIVKSCCVVPHEEGGVVVLAVSDGKATTVDCDRRIRQAIESSVDIKNVVILDTLPALSSGKIDRISCKEIASRAQ